MQTCRHCQSTDIRQTELTFQAARTGTMLNMWSFQLHLCTKCGLSDFFLPERHLDWAKEKLPPLVRNMPGH